MNHRRSICFAAALTAALLTMAGLPPTALAQDATAIAPPPGERMALALRARGVQVYECRDRTWTFTRPEAELLDTQGRIVGSHGAGPFWQLTDGSRVSGRVKARAEVPGGRHIPWLLLAADGKAPTGTLAGISHIQRLNTRGGLAPAGACVEQPPVRVPYTADYLFFRSQSE